MAITMSSPAFGAGAPIPKKHTGEGEDVSPALQWGGVPATAKELALICDDPDAPTPQPWVHWVLYKIPPHDGGLDEGKSGAALDGLNSWGERGYKGPMPPPGHGVHHYHFKLYALKAELNVGAGLTKDQLLAAMKGQILAQGELVGTYERK